VPIAGCCTLTAATGGHKVGAITIPGCRSNSPQVTRHNRHSAPNPRTSSRQMRAFLGHDGLHKYPGHDRYRAVAPMMARTLMTL
jgi:hypothetical protein